LPTNLRETRAGDPPTTLHGLADAEDRHHSEVQSMSTLGLDTRTTEAPQGLWAFLRREGPAGERLYRDDDIRRLLPLALLALPPALVGDEGRRLLRELARSLGLPTSGTGASVRAALQQYVKANPPPPPLLREFRAYLVCHLRGAGLARELSAIVRHLLPRELRLLS
jgi:hypothetical protein